MSSYRSTRRLDFLGGMVLLATLLSACGPTLHQPLDQGPISEGGSLGMNRTLFDFELTSSTNCARVGQPITLTLKLANASAITYSDVLTRSVVDLVIRGAGDWYWSDTVAEADQVRTINLAPGQLLTLTMVWTVDPAAGVPSGNSVTAHPVLRYRDPKGLQTYIGGKYLLIDVNHNVAQQSCR